MQLVNTFDISEIILPNDADLKRRLQAKLEEYRGRVQSSDRLSGRAKIIILEKLLAEGRVNRDLLQKELASKYEITDDRCFHSAFGVIWAYANGIGHILQGGTGLPK